MTYSDHASAFELPNHALLEFNVCSTRLADCALTNDARDSIRGGVKRLLQFDGPILEVLGPSAHEFKESLAASIRVKTRNAGRRNPLEIVGEFLGLSPETEIAALHRGLEQIEQAPNNLDVLLRH